MKPLKKKERERIDKGIQTSFIAPASRDKQREGGGVSEIRTFVYVHLIL